MKKIFLCLLSIIMIISTLPCISATAATGAPISSADEFMAMSPTGEYYLTADITLKSTYSKTFEGVLDGNGHSVTVSEPVFEDFSGKVINLTIEGKIVATDEASAAFALTSSKGFEAVSCTNNAPVTVTGNTKYAAGFVGTCYNAAVKFTDCVNNGAVYLDSTADEKPRAGGFGAVIDTVVMNGCVNNGNIYLKGNVGIAGGLVARVVQNAAKNCLEIYGSTNNGNVTAEDTYIAGDGTHGTGASDAGGIVGHIGISKNIGIYKIWGCRNNGNIDAPYRAGGFVGYCYGSKYDAYIDMQFCINTGNVVYGRDKLDINVVEYYDYGSAFVAYTNSVATTIKYCIDAGNLTLREGAPLFEQGFIDGTTFIGASSADITQYDLQSIYILNVEQYKYLSHSSPFLSVANTFLVGQCEGIGTYTADDLRSGKIAYEINLAAENDRYSTSASEEGVAFYQRIGEDVFPSVDASRGWVVLSGDAYANGERETEPPETTKAPETEAETTKATETTSAPETTNVPETEPTAQTGCGSMIAGAVAVVALLGTAIVFKKKG